MPLSLYSPTWDRVEKWIIAILLLAFPLQMRKIMYGLEWNFNEWVSFSIYLSDVLIFILVLVWLIRKGKETLTAFRRVDCLLLALVVWSGLSIFWSINKGVGFFNWVRVIEFSLFFLYLSRYAFGKFGLEFFAKSIIWAGLIQSILGIWQYLIQRDIGLRFLGESIIGPYISGTAAFVLGNGEKVVRAYGLTPHSNVYSVCILLAILCILWLAQRGKPSNLYLYSLPVLIFGIGVGYSRSVLLILALILILYFLIHLRRKNVHTLKIFVVVILSALAFSLWQMGEIKDRLTISSEDEAVTMRTFYNKEAAKGGIPWLGVGIGNFVPWVMNEIPSLPDNLYQPVHNLYLLIYREWGLFGSILWAMFLAQLLYISRSWSFRMLAISILILSLFDHYFLTLQQGRFIFWLALSLLTARENVV